MSKAKIVSDEALDRLLDDVVATSKRPQRDLAIVLLSFKAGLRAQEIAGLTWRDVTDASGNLSDTITVPASIAKKGHERTIPMHPLVNEALSLLREASEATYTKGLGPQPVSKTAIILSAQGWSPMSPNNLVQYLKRLYTRHGLDASSHSGRRSLITKMARVANEHGCSLFDVMQVAGHKDIETTEQYVVHSDNVHNMIRSI